MGTGLPEPGRALQTAQAALFQLRRGLRAAGGAECSDPPAWAPLLPATAETVPAGSRRTGLRPSAVCGFIAGGHAVLE